MVVKQEPRYVSIGLPIELYKQVIQPIAGRERRSYAGQLAFIVSQWAKEHGHLSEDAHE